MEAERVVRPNTTARIGRVLVVLIALWGGVLFLGGCSSSQPIEPTKEIGNPGIYYGLADSENISDEDKLKLKIRAQEEILKRQQAEAERQAREIQDLKRQDYFNRQMKPYEQ